MAMTKRDYEHVGRVLGRLPLGMREDTVSRMSETLARQNPRFDRAKFAASASLLACEECFLVTESLTELEIHNAEKHDNREEKK